jgi:hypothetical protein
MEAYVRIEGFAHLSRVPLYSQTSTSIEAYDRVRFELSREPECESRHGGEGGCAIKTLQSLAMKSFGGDMS